jgi:dihydrofolate synthase / folylpolyglutamate synthase
LIVAVADEHHPDHKIYHLDLPGLYQTKNLLTVLEACEQMRRLGWSIDNAHVEKALSQTKKMTGLYGRWEIIRHSPLLVLDVAHNIDGIKQMLQQIEITEHNQLHIIIGMVKDKEVESILSLLPPDAKYYFTKAQIPRALSEEDLQAKASGFWLKGNTFSNVNTALYASSVNAGKKDLVVVCGSIFLIGEISLHTIREIWGKEVQTTTGIWEGVEMAAWTFFA